MIFNSFGFFLFIIVLFVIYWATKDEYKKYIILIFNIFFYLGFGIKSLFILLLMILISFYSGMLIDKNRRYTKYAIAVCLIPLLLYKYLDFSLSIFKSFYYFESTSLNIIAPIGISFYTFEIISYLVDISRFKSKPEKSLINYTCYISFFGTISSGPIERPDMFIPQINKPKPFNEAKAVTGIQLFIFGLFKKIVVADNLSYYVNKIFNSIEEYSGFSLLFATVLFAFCIYCDFSGYSDMAKGVANTLNIDISTNFKAPYLSKSIKEFWSRWHISLSSWLRDYIYIPLGGNRVSKFKHYINLIITFSISGLWHGASFNYLIWGLLNGVYLVIEDIFKLNKKRSNIFLNVLSVTLVFTFISLSWIFFRANNTSDAIYCITNMFNNIINFRTYIISGLYSFDLNPLLFIQRLLIYLIPIIIADILIYNNRDPFIWINQQNIVIRYLIYILFIFMILFFHFTGETNFIYFKF